MENNPADHGGRRGGAELPDRIDAYAERVRSVEGVTKQLVELKGYPVSAKIMRIYKLLNIVKMGGQDMNPRFRLVFALITFALESVECGLLMYMLLGDAPWPIVVLCVLMAFAFIAK